MLWGGHRVPFTLLGGYLGAGKTTILNRVVEQTGGRRLVVLVNDIGAVNVDAALVAEHDGTTMALTNGCVCCAIADDFGETLEVIRSMVDPPDQVLMELSGVAEPARVAPWAATAGFRLDGVVVAVDADQISGQLDRVDIGDTVLAQLSAADLVVLTKTDLLDDGGAAAAVLVATVTDAPAISTASLPPTLLLGIDHESTGSPPTAEPVLAAHGYAVAVVDFDGGRRLELDRLLDALPPDVVRAKGIVRCSDVENLVEVHVVGRRRTIRHRAGPASDELVGRIVTISLTAR